MSAAVEFPQPEVVAPAYRADYFFIDNSAEVTHDLWGSDSFPDGVPAELHALAKGLIYLSREACEQRAAWNAQEMARLVTPAWFRAIGDDVQYKIGGGEWARFGPESVKSVYNWSKEKPENYRAKPVRAPDVVVNVNGKEYRWPATVASDAPEGARYIVRIAGDSVDIRYGIGSHAEGNRTHFTRAGAEAQAAMLVAALGGGV